MISSNFDNIKAYISLINLNKLNSFTFLDTRKEETKINRFYNLVVAGRTEREIELQLGYSKNSKAFQKLQSRLLSKLRAALFILDERSAIFTGLGLEFFKLFKSLFQHRILLMLNKKNLSFETIEKDLSVALKLEFPDIILQLARPLRDHYAFIQPNKQKFKLYDKIISSAFVSYQVELLTSKYYGVISRDYIYKKKNKEELIQTIDKYNKEVASFGKFMRSHRHVFEDFEINSLKYDLTGESEKKIKYCISTLEFFKHKEYETYQFKYNIINDLTISYIITKRFDFAIEKIKELESIFPSGHYNWFRIKELDYRIKIINKNYNEAFILVWDCLKQTKFKVYENIQESWKIKSAYMHFLLELNKVDRTVIKEYPISTFRLSKFLNDVPVFSKVKRGLNISILIIQMIFYLLHKKTDQFVDRMDALKQYSYRYLKNDDAFRSNCFIKMLLKIPETHFHPVALERHTKPLFIKLKNTPLPVSDITTNAEIIPYEDLWEMVLELLEKNR